jgi:hypothetical protein
MPIIAEEYSYSDHEGSTFPSHMMHLPTAPQTRHCLMNIIVTLINLIIICLEGLKIIKLVVN